jgi:hypothetical protein
LDVLSPWLDALTRDRDAVVAMFDAQPHRRFIKTHTPLDGLPWDDRVTYICVSRDPRDVALSWDNHMDNMNMVSFIEARAKAVGLDDIADLLAEGPPPRPESELERFWAWVEGPGGSDAAMPSLRSTMEHVQTFWKVRERPNIIMLRYEDLQRDLEGQMRMVAQRLGIEVEEELWPDLVKAATFDEMRSRPEQLAPEVTTSLWHDTGQFFHRGTCGQWRALVDDAGERRYEAVVTSVGDPELAAWMHDPPLAG